MAISVPVLNGRLMSLSLERNGFELLPHAYDHIDYMDEESIVNRYYSEACNLVQSATGAEKVIAFDHNVRCSAKKSWMNKDGQTDPKAEIKGGNVIQSPASIVHNDYTLTSAPLRLKKLSEPARMNDTWKSLVPPASPLISPEELADRLNKRYVMINVWRNISDTPVEDMPLGLCDGSTLSPEDLITFEIRYSDRIGENYFAKYSPSHKWVYFPKMEKDEAILLKVWDSDAALGGEAESSSATSLSCFSLHSAFPDPDARVDCPQRESIEIRTVAFY